MPEQCNISTAYILDPMIATGCTAIASIDILKEWGAPSIAIASVLATPQGLAEVQRKHPEVKVFVAGVDGVLDEQGWIVPGLGDIGQRMFGTGY